MDFKYSCLLSNWSCKITSGWSLYTYRTCAAQHNYHSQAIRRGLLHGFSSGSNNLLHTPRFLAARCQLSVFISPNFTFLFAKKRGGKLEIHRMLHRLVYYSLPNSTTKLLVTVYTRTASQPQHGQHFTGSRCGKFGLLW